MQPLRGRRYGYSNSEPGVREARPPALMWNPFGVTADDISV
jgi:hypothetical protein